MSREKQNEEMAQCLCGWNRGTLCILDDKDCNLQCTYGKLANELTAKGYRKSTDLAEEIFAEIEEHLKQTGKKGYVGTISGLLAELKKKYLGEDTNVPTKESEKEKC